MIRSVYKLMVPTGEPEYRALLEMFRSLGLREGESWDGRRSKGVKFCAADAGVEVALGEGFPSADVVIEADSADEVYEVAKKQKLTIVDDIVDADWGGRMFTLAAPAGLRLAIFSYTTPPAARHELAGSLNAAGMRFGIVVARFNSFITERLLAGTVDALRRAGADEQAIRIARVPGAFEIPAASRAMAETRQYSAIICIGCLLRGDTLHYEVIANEVARGIGQSAQETLVPHAFGVLTCDTLEQATDRAGLKAGNKGFEAALSAVEMANLKKKVSG